MQRVMRDQEYRRDERPPVWAVGGNTRGQLGLGFASDYSSSPKRVAFQLQLGQRVIEIFGGYEHTFALTSDGDVLAFGNGVKGQLGIGNTDSHSSPQKVRLLCGKRVVKMAAGLEHSLALTESDDMYSFGDNLSGQLGLGDNFIAKQQTPQHVLSLSKVKVTQMACGQDHTAVLTSAGELFCFGNNRYGALGVAGHRDEGPPIVAAAPQLVDALRGKSVMQIGCGLQHTVALTGTGQVYCWGNNSRGQLGTGDTQNRYTPTLVCKPLSSARSIHVACGGQHTLALTDKDELYGFGSDRHGQLGLGQGGNYFPVPSRIVRLGGRRVDHAVGGAWHTVVRTDTGESYVMGCILPSANIPPTDGTTPVQDNNNHNNNNPDGAIHARGSLRRAAIATGPTSPLDPFALSFGGFRRLMLPRGAEACSKGHSLFYGQGLGPPPRALRKDSRSVGRLKEDISRMLRQQDPDVIFTCNPDGQAAYGSYGGYRNGSKYTVGAHLAVLRARCPSLYEHAAAAITKSSSQGETHQRDQNCDARPEAWRVPSPPGVPIAALRLVISYLYEEVRLFDRKKTEATSAPKCPTPAESRRQQQHRAWLQQRRHDRQDQEVNSAAIVGDQDGHQDISLNGAVKTDMSTLDGYEVDTHEEAWQERGEGDWEEAAGFGSFGGGGGHFSGGGGEVRYDGFALDRLMGVMAAARTLQLKRLQGSCEKRAEAFVDCRTVHKVLKRAAEGGFPYLKRRCLEFCFTHLIEVCAPENSGQVVSELSSHPQVLADVLSLSAASDAARMCAARGIPFEGPGNIPCIEALRDEAACVVPDDSYQKDFLALFEAAVQASSGQTSLQYTSTPAESFGDWGMTSKQREEGRSGAGAGGSPETSTSISTDVIASGDGGTRKDTEVATTTNADNRNSEWVHPIEAQGDFTIRAGEGTEPVTVHKCILAARSGFFRALLEGNMVESAKSELVLKFKPVVRISALLQFLRFLYTGRTGVMDPLTALDVLPLTRGEYGSGGYFQVSGNDELRACCTSTIVEGLNRDNALTIVVRAKALGDEDSLSSAIEFLLNNFHECMRPPPPLTPSGRSVEEVDEVPSCLEDDCSPAVDVLLAMAKRCTVVVKKRAAIAASSSTS